MAWPTSSNPKTQNVPCRFTASEVADLDAVCRTLGMSRSEFVRKAVGSAVKRAAKNSQQQNSQQAGQQS